MQQSESHLELLRQNASATTDWNIADFQQQISPHTHVALQHLVMAMADAYNNRGKTGFFGRDKGLKAYKKFDAKLGDLIIALRMDRKIGGSQDADTVRQIAIQTIAQFQLAFPNWPDAYIFAREYFIDGAAAANQRIAALVR